MRKDVAKQYAYSYAAFAASAIFFIATAYLVKKGVTGTR